MDREDPDHMERFAAGERPTNVPSPTTAEEPAVVAPGLDRESFVALLRSHDDRMRGLAYKLLGGDRDRMDDALQDAYLRAFAARTSFRQEADLGTWLYRIVYNACVDELRRGGRRPEPVDLTTGAWERPSSRPGPDAVVGAADATVRALASLPADQRVTVVLVDGEGFDNVAAARILGVAPGTVGSRLSRARRALRRALAPDDEAVDHDDTGTDERNTAESSADETGTAESSTGESGTAEAGTDETGTDQNGTADGDQESER
jgi:RNA polymerase sigma-70 factor (ECF subfamily)